MSGTVAGQVKFKGVKTGGIPQEWVEASLGEICRLRAGSAFKSEYQGKMAGNYPFVKVSDMNLAGNEIFIRHANNWINETERKELKASLHPAGATIFAKIGIALTYNRRRFLIRDTVIDNNMMSAIPDEQRVDPKYLYYFLCLQDFNLLADGSALPFLSVNALEKISFLLPPLAEQRAIAKILSDLDAKVELNRRMNETLEQMARAIFKQWFVDFEFPGHEKAKFVDGLPEGWNIKNIYVAADVIYGAPFSSKLFNTNGIGKPLIRIRDLANEKTEVFTLEVHPKGYLMKLGDIVVGMDGEFRAHLWGGQTSWLNQRICVFAPKKEFSAPFVMNSIIPLLAEIEATETATTVIHLGKSDIDKFNILIPDPKILNLFNQSTESLFAQIVINKQEISSLSQIRNTLLPKLMSGEIRV